MKRPAALPSIRQRLAFTLLVWAVLGAGLLALVTGYVTRHELEELRDQGLRESAEIVLGLVALQPDAPRGSGLQPPVHNEQLIWQLLSQPQHVVLRSSHKAPAAPLLAHARPGLADTADGQWRVATLAWPGRDDRLLLVAESRAARAADIGEVVRWTLLGAGVVGALGLLLLIVQTRRELWPLYQLTAAVQAHDPLSGDSGLGPATRAELAPITQAIEALGQRLAQRVASERAFSAHAAHALRTPLAGIDVQLALALRELPAEQQGRVARAREAAQGLSRVVQALLLLFRSGLEPQWQRVDLPALLHNLPTQSVHIVFSGEPTVQADPNLLAATLANLLDNAQRHHARRLQVHCVVSPEGTRLLLQDDGSGCTPERLAELRHRLQCITPMDAFDNPVGLGLVLAQTVMRAHQGEVQLPAPEQGFAVLLSWPNAERTGGDAEGQTQGDSTD